MMSASAPAGSANSSIGTSAATWTSATSAAESGVSTRIHCAPTVCIQVPSMLPSWASHSARKARIRSGAHSDGTEDDDSGAAAPDRPTSVTGRRPDAGSTPDLTDPQPTLVPIARSQRIGRSRGPGS